MTGFDVKVEFVNGQGTWSTIEAADANDAERIVSAEYERLNLHTVWAITAYPWGTRPGDRRRPRKAH